MIGRKRSPSLLLHNDPIFVAPQGALIVRGGEERYLAPL